MILALRISFSTRYCGLAQPNTHTVSVADLLVIDAHRVSQALVEHCRYLERDQSDRIDFDRHVGQHKLDGLIIYNLGAGSLLYCAPLSLNQGYLSQTDTNGTDWWPGLFK